VSIQYSFQLLALPVAQLVIGHQQRAQHGLGGQALTAEEEAGQRRKAAT